MTNDVNNYTEQQKKYAYGATAYQSTHVNTMSGFEIIAELYKGMMLNITQAKKAYKDKELEHMCHLIEKTNKILLALQSRLNFERGGEAAEFLNELYNGIFIALARILRTKDPENQFDRILDDVKPIYQIWVEHAKVEKSTG